MASYPRKGSKGRSRSGSKRTAKRTGGKRSGSTRGGQTVKLVIEHVQAAPALPETLAGERVTGKRIARF